jgi:hypothetical protein
VSIKSNHRKNLRLRSGTFSKSKMGILHEVLLAFACLKFADALINATNALTKHYSTGIFRNEIITPLMAFESEFGPMNCTSVNIKDKMI